MGLPHFWGLALPVGLSFLLGMRAIWLNLFFVIIIALIVGFYKRRIGCITGDMLGAMTEMTEAALFLLLSIGGL